MRAAIGLVVSLALLCACSPRPDSHRIVATWPRAESERSLPAPSPQDPKPVAEEETLPPDDPTYSAVDATGRTPEEVLTELIEFGNEGDWKSAYAMYASPEVDRETFARERIRAREVYLEFSVHEVRVTDEAHAVARVSYTIPAEGANPGLDIQSPGEWWGLTLVDGVWKVNWLPRQ